MVTTNPVINELMTLLSQKRAGLHEFEQQMEQALKARREDIQAIERTIELYQNGRVANSRIMVPALTTNIIPSELHGMTQMGALDHIAEKNEGRIKVSLAKRLLIEAGIAKGNPRYLMSSIYHLLENSGKYEKVAPGEFMRIRPER